MTDLAVDLAHHPEAERVVANVDGDSFTAYRYEDDRTKPVLYPVNASTGAPVTRGYPIDPRPGERVDHVHHVGAWFNHGHVNGHDLWNYDGDPPLAGAEDGGIVSHDSVERVESGAPAVLETTATWVTPDGEPLVESTTFRFSATTDRRTIDRETTLTAREHVELHDDKEGMFAIRVATGLEPPSDGATTRIDTDGEVRELAEVPGDDPSGEYYTSASVWSDGVWGSKAKWVRLSGTVGGDDLTVTLMDHAENPGHPAHWHARHYGLFAANPLSPSVFSYEEFDPLHFELATGESVTFRFRIDVDEGEPSGQALEERWEEWVE